MQLWPMLPNRDFTAASAAAGQVRVVEHDERVGPAELEHALLEGRPAVAPTASRPARCPVSVTAATRGSPMIRGVISGTS